MEFTFNGTGTVVRVDKTTASSGKVYTTLIVETDGQYRQMIPIKVFGRAADDADELAPGDVVQVSGRLGGREWNGRCYGDIVGTAIEIEAKAKTGRRGATFNPVSCDDRPAADDDTPF